MITRAGIGHTYNTTEKKVTHYFVEITQTPLYVELIDQLHTKAHEYTRKIPWLYNAVCWALCQRDDALIEAWIYHKTKHFHVDITDEQRDEFRRIFNDEF